jgi:hypothetical protein
MFSESFGSFMQIWMLKILCKTTLADIFEKYRVYIPILEVLNTVRSKLILFIFTQTFKIEIKIYQ